MTSPVVIIGAGLSGLGTAWRLAQANIPVIILEANASAGGRIQPANSNLSHQDSGPTWVWPYAQPTVVAWLTELALASFDQFDSGDALYDKQVNQQATRHPIPAQFGSKRIVGGTYAIIQQLITKLNNSTANCSIKFNQPVHAIEFNDSIFDIAVQVGTTEPSLTTLKAEHLIIATPLRIAAQLIQPMKSSLADVLPYLQTAPTWMAPQAKAIIFYDHAFWRDLKLSGRIASHAGPLTETHDHCGPDGRDAAIFGFIGVPFEQRQASMELLKEQIQQQLCRCFGNDAPKPVSIEIKDWASERYTTTEIDLNEPAHHPQILHDNLRKGWCDERLWFCVSETSLVSPGLIEGAMASSDRTAENMQRCYFNHVS